MKTRVLSGCTFTDADSYDGQPVIAINQTLAREYFPGEAPLGQQIQVGRDTVGRVIVGIAADVNHNSLLTPVKRAWFIPATQWARSYGNPRRAMTLMIRTTSDSRGVLTPVQRLVHDMDADLR